MIRNLILASATAMLCLSMAAPAAVIGRMMPAQPLSEARVAALPAAERAVWTAYLQRSRARMAADRAALAAEREGLAVVPGNPPQGRAGAMKLDREPAWYAGAEARRIADNIVSFQTPSGGWGKNQDRSGPVRARGQTFHRIESLPDNARSSIVGDRDWAYVGTIDNGATTTELRFLARVQRALPGAEGEAYRQAAVKGLVYLLEAQYPNGGWPQIYPLEGGYHDAVTFNDEGLSEVAGLLLAASGRDGDFAFVPPAVAARARAAVDRAIGLVVATQIVVDGKRTGWGQQYDPLTLAPAGARNFEPVALSSAESAAVLSFLMGLPAPSAEVVAAVHDGVAWLQARALRDVEWPQRATSPEGRRLVARPGAGPIWSRFYDLRTMRPIFGDRDRSIHDDVNAISLERRNGYSWYGTGPAATIKLYQKWAASHGRR